jgi:type VI protein secretion system component VasK
MTFGKTAQALVFTAIAGIGAGLFSGYTLANQPRMQSALDHLQAAQNDLQAADNDKGGHRKNALDLTQRAIAQVRKGMNYDRKN